MRPALALALIALVLPAGCFLFAEEVEPFEGAAGAGGRSGTGGAGGAAPVCEVTTIFGVEARLTGREVIGRETFDEHFGRAFVFGDVDGDGAIDLVVGAPLSGDVEPGEPVPPENGAFYVLFGPFGDHVGFGEGATRPARWIAVRGGLRGDRFGSSVAILPHARGGGDVLVGSGYFGDAPLAPHDPQLEGGQRAHLFDGAALASAASSGGGELLLDETPARLWTLRFPSRPRLPYVWADPDAPHTPENLLDDGTPEVTIAFAAPDLDGDGEAELLLGRPLSLDGQLRKSPALLLTRRSLGAAASAPDRTLEAEALEPWRALPEAGGRAAQFHATAGGAWLLAIGSPFSGPGELGEVRVHDVSQPGPPLEPTDARWRFEGATAYPGETDQSEFGAALLFAELHGGAPEGPELVIGAPAATRGEGAAQLYTLAADGPVLRLTLRSPLHADTIGLGRALTTVPDLDHDGLPELALAAPEFDTLLGEVEARDGGAAWVLGSARIAAVPRGRDVEPAELAAVHVEGPEAHVGAGYTLAAPGDGRLWVSVHRSVAGKILAFDLQADATCWGQP